MVSTQYISEEIFFVLHNVNCYEVNNQLVLDLIAYPSPEIINKLYIDKMRSGDFGHDGEHPRLKRFVLPLVDNMQVDLGTSNQIIKQVYLFLFFF